MAAAFKLHERLADDTVEVERWSLSRVLLMNDSSYPWLILVPQRPGLRDFHDLADDDLPVMTGEIVRASRLLQDSFQPHKINVAALGNQVPQLHVHVIARFTDDAAWPGPVWGVVPTAPYAEDALEDRLALLRRSSQGA
ncbi:MAG: HIT family protein [Kiloniellales bacterium]|nr:HIT family protein [Kiloniellales bacterium]